MIQLRKKILTTGLALSCIVAVNAQDSLNTTTQSNELSFDEQGVEEESTVVLGTFKTNRVINGHSVDNIGDGSLDFRMQHRFGKVTDGYKEFFGMDIAHARFSFDYGVTDKFNIGIARSAIDKTHNGFLKYKILQQKKGGVRPTPLTITLLTQATFFHGKLDDLGFSNSLAYVHQAMIGRKFSRKIAFQVTPTLVHKNLVDSVHSNNLFFVGVSGRYAITRRVHFVVEYFHNVTYTPDEYNAPLAFGFDIETGGHTFQLIFSNSSAMEEHNFLLIPADNALKGEFHFGFNLARIFNLKNKVGGGHSF